MYKDTNWGKNFNVISNDVDFLSCEMESLTAIPTEIGEDDGNWWGGNLPNSLSTLYMNTEMFSVTIDGGWEANRVLRTDRQTARAHSCIKKLSNRGKSTRLYPSNRYIPMQYDNQNSSIRE
jgi:hypothetical protein